MGNTLICYNDLSFYVLYSNYKYSINRGYLLLLSFGTKKDSKDIGLDRDGEDLPERIQCLGAFLEKPLGGS